MSLNTLLNSSWKKLYYSGSFLYMLFFGITMFLVGVVTVQGQDFFSAEDLRFEHLQRKHGLPDNSVLSIIEDRNGLLWMGSFSGLFKYDGYTFQSFKEDPSDPTSIKGSDIYTLFEDDQGFIWAATWGGVNRIDPISGDSEFIPCFDPQNFVKGVDFKNHAITQDYTGAIWVGSGYGFSVIEDPSSNEFIYRNDHGPPEDLTQFLEDIEGSAMKSVSIDSVSGDFTGYSSFLLGEPSSVFIVSYAEIGPGIYDYGWLENQEGNVLWKVTDGATIHAGGGLDNRMHVGIVNLPPGEYRVRFFSDMGHHFDSWARKPPADPGSYGIQAYILDSTSIRKATEIVDDITIHTESNPGSFVIAMYTDDKNDTWMGTNRGLYLLERTDRESHNSVTQSSPKTFSRISQSNLQSQTITALSKGSQGIWVAGLQLNNEPRVAATLDLYYPESKTARSWELPLPEGASVRDFIEDTDGHLWFGTNGYGIFKLSRNQWLDKSRNTLALSRFDLSLANKSQYQSNDVFSIYEDPGQNKWFGTWDDGLFKLNPNSNLFQVHPLEPGLLSVSDDIEINGVIVDQLGQYWLGTKNHGLIVLDSDLRVVFQLNDFAQRFGLTQTDLISDLYEDEHGFVWVSTFRNGIFRISLDFTQIKRYPSGLFEDIARDKNGNLWLSTKGGLFFYDWDTDRFRHDESNSDDSTSISGNALTRIIIDKDGIAWIGSDGTGLNKSQQPIDRYSDQSPMFYHFLKSVNVLDIYDDGAGFLWLGTNARGLIKFDKSTSSYESYTVRDGLVSDQVESILADASAYLWIFTPSGLSRFNPSDESIISYTQADGLEFPEIQGVSRASKTRDGRFIFGGINGFYSFHPDSLDRPSIITRIMISSIEVGDRKKEIAEILKLGLEDVVLELPSTTTFVNINYSGLDYDRASQMEYRFRLRGLNEQWEFAGDERSARYAFLPAGSYTFEVQARGRNRTWSESKILVLSIARPWYATTAAYLLYLLVASILLVLVRRYYLSRIEIRQKLKMQEFENAKLAELNALKTRFYNNLSHEFRTPMTVVLGMADRILKDRTHDLSKKIELIKRNGNQILHLINQMLDLSRLEGGAVKFKLQDGDIIREIRYLVDSFSSFAVSKSVQLEMHTEHEAIWVQFDPEVIRQIVSNLIVNAIKFTHQDGAVKVFVSPTDQNKKKYIEVEVRDNGRGISPNDITMIFDRFYRSDNGNGVEIQGSGIGLALVKELVDQLNGEINVESKLGHGSTFTVLLPYIEASTQPTTNPMVSGHQLNANLTNEKLKMLDEDLAGQMQPIHTSVKILIIDDNKDIIDYIQMLLGDEYQLLTALDGQSGLELARQVMPDIIISDVMMPVMDGYALCEALKSDILTSHIPIILLTARADHQDRMKGLALGADAYISKPFKREELLIRIEKLTEVRSNFQQYFNGLFKSEMIEQQSLKREGEFLRRVRKHVLENLQNDSFGHQDLEKHLQMSRTQLYAKVKALTGKSVALHIRSIRLEEAYRLLGTDDLNITELAYRVGFKSGSHFSRYFKEEFGHSPSSLLKVS